jgi:hypothetical protein
MKKYHLIALGFCALASVAGRAETYFEDFANDTAFPNGFSISTWLYTSGSYTNDGLTYQAAPPSTGEWVTDEINLLNTNAGATTGFSSPAGEDFALIGGAVVNPPSVPAPTEVRGELWTPLNQAGNTTFTVDFSVLASVNAKRDYFGWVFRDLSGATILDLQIRYDATNIAGRKLDMYANGSLAMTSGSTNAELGYSAKYKLTLSLNDTLDTYSAVLNTYLAPDPGDPWTGAFTDTQLFSGAVNAGTGVGAIAAYWQIATGNTADWGSNSMIFSNYNVVPEPSTALAAVAGAAYLALLRRRRNR